jgi:hypothetical protein
VSEIVVKVEISRRRSVSRPRQTAAAGRVGNGMSDQANRHLRAASFRDRTRGKWEMKARLLELEAVASKLKEKAMPRQLSRGKMQASTVHVHRGRCARNGRQARLPMHTQPTGTRISLNGEPSLSRHIHDFLTSYILLITIVAMTRPSTYVEAPTPSR